MREISLNDRQIEEFAKVIFADIETYVESHPDEFQEFLKNEELKKRGETSDISDEQKPKSQKQN